MTHGFDTSFLVAAEVLGHPDHQTSRTRLRSLRSAGDDFAIAPQVLAEFVHVVTDPRRFSHPLNIDAALSRAEAWWSSTEVMHVFPTSATLQEFFQWMQE